MGSYSMGCGLSGLEIGERDLAYVALMRPEKHSRGSYVIAVPPVRGFYDDSGSLHIEDDPAYLAAWGVTPEENWWEPLDHDPQNMAPLWISGLLFEQLGQLPREYPNESIEQSCNAHLVDVAADVAKAVQSKAKWEAMIESIADEAVRKEFTDDENGDPPLWATSLTSHLGYCNRTLHEIDAKLAAAIKADQDPAPVLEGYRRALTLGVAAADLRKQLIPSDSRVGPQHGGSVILSDFYKRVLNIAKERLGEDKEMMGD